MEVELTPGQEGFCPAESTFDEYDAPEAAKDPVPYDLEGFQVQFEEASITIHIDVKKQGNVPAKRVIVVSPGLVRADGTRAVIQFSNQLRKAEMPEVAKPRGKRPWVKPHEFPIPDEKIFEPANLTRQWPLEGEPWFYTCMNHPAVRLTPELAALSPENRGMWGKCYGQFLSVRIGRFGDAVRRIADWRRARALHRGAGGDLTESSTKYPINWNEVDPCLHKLYPFPLPRSVRQHVRFGPECRSAIEEDWWRRQCYGYGTAEAPHEDYVPPSGDEDEPSAPAEVAATTEVAYGRRSETMLTEVAAMTELHSKAREGKWPGGSTSASGIVTANLVGEGVADVGQALTQHRAVLEAKQSKWDKATAKAAKQFAVRNDAWYEDNPRWVPKFVHGPIKEAKRAGGDLAESSQPSAKRPRPERNGAPEEGISPNHGKPYHFPAFHSGIRPNGSYWQVTD